MPASFTLDAPSARPVSSVELHEAIRRRAEEIYTQSGRIPGRDLENWSQAEAEILREAGTFLRRTAVVVEVDGVQYVGEYRSESCGGYQLGEFDADAAVTVRFQGEKMFVKRPNGRELETTVVKKIG